MRVALFCHSLLSDFNHGNAHFLRGIATELLARRHDVKVFEPYRASSVEQLVVDHGPRALDLVKAAYPRLKPIRYELAAFDLDEALDGVDLVLVHERNDAELVARIGERRKRPGARFKLLFHDTHHRSITDPSAFAAYDLSGYDGVLAFAAAVREAYLKRGWAERVWTWHEAADPRVFFPYPPPPNGKEADVVWIGSWRDEDGSKQLVEMFLDPLRDAGLRAVAYGARYPDHAKELLRARRAEHRGWLPNFLVPEVFARFKMTVHIPPRPYVDAVPGVPTIRVFEALASGLPLVSAPWNDVDGLFSAGRDYLVARDAAEMQRHMRELANDAHRRSELARCGRRTILARHTCAHRVDELIAVAVQLGVRAQRPVFLEAAAVS